MSISVKLAYQNVFKDEEWKYKVFVITVLTTINFMSLFSNAHKQNPLILIISGIMGLIMAGYFFKYMNALLEDKEAKLPDFDSFIDLFFIGLKFVIGTFFLGIAIKLFCVLIALPCFLLAKVVGVVVAIILIVYLYSLIPAFIINFSEEFNIGAMIDFKKAREIAKFNYYKALFILGFINIIPMIFSLLTWFVSGYFVIIYSYFSTLFSLISSHILVQVFHSEYGERVNYGF